MFYKMMKKNSDPQNLENDSTYYWEANRLKTFSMWPFDDKHQCNPAKMAEAGFYACGTPRYTDLAKCPFCDKELDGWEPDDDPWEEHKKHSKKCLFMKVGRPESQLTISEHIELMRNYFKFRLEQRTEERLKKEKVEVKEIVDALL